MEARASSRPSRSPLKVLRMIRSDVLTVAL